MDDILYFVCRLCAEKKKDMVPIFSNKANNLGVQEKINACLSPVNVVENDGMPLKICTSCLEQLSSSYKFHQSCVNAQETIKKMIAKEAGTSIQNTIKVKEIATMQQPNNTRPVLQQPSTSGMNLTPSDIASNSDNYNNNNKCPSVKPSEQVESKSNVLLRRKNEHNMTPIQNGVVLSLNHQEQNLSNQLVFNTQPMQTFNLQQQLQHQQLRTIQNGVILLSSQQQQIVPQQVFLITHQRQPVQPQQDLQQQQLAQQQQNQTEHEQLQGSILIHNSSTSSTNCEREKKNTMNNYVQVQQTITGEETRTYENGTTTNNALSNKATPPAKIFNRKRLVDAGQSSSTSSDTSATTSIQSVGPTVEMMATFDSQSVSDSTEGNDVQGPSAKRKKEFSVTNPGIRRIPVESRARLVHADHSSFISSAPSIQSDTLSVDRMENLESEETSFEDRDNMQGPSAVTNTNSEIRILSVETSHKKGGTCQHCTSSPCSCKPEKEKEAGSFIRCPYCCMHIHAGQIQTHYKFHNDHNLFSCLGCDKSFSSEEEMATHDCADVNSP